MPQIKDLPSLSTTTSFSDVAFPVEETVDGVSITKKANLGFIIAQAAGTPGYAGSSGIGYTGSRGVTGTNGTNGYTGSLGSTGYNGSIGSTGYTGSQGTAGDRYATQSADSLTLPISAGITTITIETGLAYSVNQGILVSFSTSTFVQAEVESYNPATGAMQFVNPTSTGVGTYNTWTVNLAGAVGAIGYTGSIGVGYTGSTGNNGTVGYTGSAGAGGSSIATSSTSVDRSMTYWVGTDSSTLYSAANVLLSTDDLALEISSVRVGIPLGDNGADNLVLGIGAMGAELPGSLSQFNTAIGHGALAASTGATAFDEAYRNTAVGYYALNNHYTSEYNGENTAVGYYALRGMQAGHDNTAVGSTALGVSLGNGNRNTAVGSHALESLTSSADNIAIGTYAANNITSGLGQNIIIGNSSVSSVATAAGQIVIGHALTGLGNNTAYIGGSSGAYNGANSTSWAITSDERIKKNIVDNGIGLNAIKQVRVRNFNYKSKEEMPLGLEGNPLASNLDTTKTVTGVIAQEFQEAFPNSVKVNSNGVLSVNTDEMIWAMVNAIKELSAEITALKAQIASLTS